MMKMKFITAVLGMQKSLKAVSSANIRCMRALSTRTPSSLVSLESSDVELSYSFYPTDNETLDAEKIPLFFLHGLLGAKGNVHSVAKHLSSTGRRVITYDTRNHGSSGHVDKMDFPSMAQDLHDLIGELQFKQPAVLGHSLGGKTAMICALKYPGVMSSLTVADVGPNISPSVLDLDKYVEAMIKADIPQTVGLIKARKNVEMQLAPVISSSFLLSYLMTNLVKSGDGRIEWRPNLDIIYKSLDILMGFPTENITPYSKPTLFVFGAASPHYKEADMGQIKSLFPSAQIEVIAGAGHFIHVDKPLEFTKIVQEFLKSTDSK